MYFSIYLCIFQKIFTFSSRLSKPSFFKGQKNKKNVSKETELKGHNSYSITKFNDKL